MNKEYGRSVLWECYADWVIAEELKRIQNYLADIFFIKPFEHMRKLEMWEYNWLYNDEWDGEGIA